MKLKHIFTRVYRLPFINLFMFVAAAGLFVFAVLYWNTHLASNPSHLFWSAMDNALSNSGVNTSTQSADGNGVTYDQLTSLRFAGNVQSDTIVAVNSSNGAAVTETLGDATHDFIRYKKLRDATGDIGQSYVNKWASATVAKGGNGRLASEAAGSTIIFTGNFDYTRRSKFINYLKQIQAFRDIKVVAKNKNVDGRKVDVVSLVTTQAKHNLAMRDYLSLLGLTASASQISDGAKNDTQVELAIDRTSEQFVAVGVPDLSAAQTIHFSNWGSALGFTLPKADMTYDQLQALMQK